MEINPLSLIVPDAYVGPNLQAAVNQAANNPKASVWIPASYSGTDTYTNPSNVPVFDLRGIGTLSFASSSSTSIVSSGLMAQYRILPTETPASLVDYSGNGNNATGTVGTTPTIISVTGGLQFNGNGAVSLPASLNTARTIILYTKFHSNDIPATSTAQPIQALVLGNDSTFVSGVGKICGVALRGGIGATHDVWGNTTNGGRQVRSILAQNSNIYATSSLGIVEGFTSVALVQDTNDLIYIGGVKSKVFQSAPTAGLQTAGNYQLGGCAQGTGLQNFLTYLTGSIYYALFYNRVLTPSEIEQNDAAMSAELVARGVLPPVGLQKPFIGGAVLQTAGSAGATGLLDVNPQVVLRGDSITAGQLSVWTDSLAPASSAGLSLQINNLGLPGDSLVSSATAATPFETDSMYRPGATNNLAFIWLGVNDAVSAALRAGYIRQFCADRRANGWRVIPTTITSNNNEASPTGTNALNNWLRTNWMSFADGLCDVSANPNLGALGANLNSTYFPDGLHPSALANSSLIAPLFQREIDRTFGRKDFSDAYTATVNSGPTFVQSSNNGFDLSNATFVNSVFKTDNLPGSFLLMATDSGTVTSVSDSNNNLWQVLHTQRTGAIWYAQNCKSGPNTVTVKYNALVTKKGFIAEYAGVSKTVTPLIANAIGTGTSLSSGNITTAVNGSLVIGIAMNTVAVNTYTPGVSFATDILPTSSNTEYFEHLVQGVAGTIAATATIGSSVNWDMTVVGLAPDTGATYVMQDRDVSLLASPTAGSLTIQLVPATGLTGQHVKIKNTQTTGANTVTVIPTPLAITNAVANGATVTFTVPNTVNLIAGQTILVSGCTTSALNATYTITSVTATTVVCPSATSVTEAETTAQLISEFIDGAGSVVIANNAELVLEAVLNQNASVRGNNWMSVTQ